MAPGLGLIKVLVGPALADLGAIIVAPETLDRGWTSADNERAVVALLDAVQATYRVDPRRVVVTGFSMGGAGTWHFASRFPERFSAAIPMAGRPPADIGAWKMPVLAIHSRSDEVVPIAPTEARIKALKDAGVRAELIVLNGIAHHETYRFADGLRRALPWLRDTWKKLEAGPMTEITRRDFVRTSAIGALASGAGAAEAFGRAPAIRQGGARPVIISSANGHEHRNGGPVTCVEHAFKLMTSGTDVLEALVAGVNIVELDPEETSVGYGGLPNADGVVQLDACCMHGARKRAGGVAALEGVRTPASVARP